MNSVQLAIIYYTILFGIFIKKLYNILIMTIVFNIFIDY